MKNFLQIAHGVDVLPLLLEVQRQPELWNRNPCRLGKIAPHFETQDMILRYKDDRPGMENFNNWLEFSNEHIPDWYKVIDFLPSARRLIFDIMARVQGEMLGGVFLYKLEPGKKIYPHKDSGWHADSFDKFNVCLSSNERSAFCYDNGERMVQRPGDVHHFRNDACHWVINDGDTDHIVMTVCVKVDRGARIPFAATDWSFDKQAGELCQQLG
jgi:hypothetical protein